MKIFTSLVSAMILLGASASFIASASAASSSKNARENQITAELNRAQLAANPSVAQAPTETLAAAPAVMAAPPPTVINGKIIPPGASCGIENPSCAQQLSNPAANSVSQFRQLGVH